MRPGGFSALAQALDLWQRGRRVGVVDCCFPNMLAHLPPICVYHGSVCVCIFFPFILGIKFVGRTSRGHTGGRSHKISHPPSFCDACLNFSREKDSAILSLVDREVEICVVVVFSH